MLDHLVFGHVIQDDTLRKEIEVARQRRDKGCRSDA